MEGRTLRPLGVGEILDASINLYFRNLGTFFKTAAVVAIPMAVIIFLLDQIAFQRPEPGNLDDLGIGMVGEYSQRVDLSTFNTIFGIEILLALFAFLLIIGASFKAVSDLYTLGTETSSGESIRVAGRRLHSMLWAGLLFSLGVALASFALFLPAIWLMTAWCLFIPVLLAEGLKGSKALGRSFDLVRHNWWRTFGALLVGLIFIGLFQFLLGLAATGLTNLTDDSLQGSLLIQDSFQALVLIITAPLEAAIIAVIYYDLRVRKEAFDVHVLTQQLESPGSAPPAEAPLAAGTLPHAPGETPPPAPGSSPPPPPPPPSTPSGW